VDAWTTGIVRPILPLIFVKNPCDMGAFFIFRTLLCVFVFSWTVLHWLSDV
jgi:hypothetical protein